MHPLTQAIAPWHDFYTLLGAASATMIGLLFVAVSVGSGVFSQARPGPLRIFLSASVVQFGCVLGNCLLMLAPLGRADVLGGVVLACGVAGLGYAGMAWRDTVRDGLSAKIDLEDRLWYAVGPAIGYFMLAAAGAALIAGRDLGCPLHAVAVGAMLLVAIHNAWDITVWSVTRSKRE